MARQPLQPVPPPADGALEPGALSPASPTVEPGALSPKSPAVEPGAAPSAPGAGEGAAPAPAEAAAAAAGPDQAFWARLGWQPSDQQLSQFMALQELLRHWNQRVNLTRLVEGDDYWIAQVFDSLWPLQSLLPIAGLETAEAGTTDASTDQASTGNAGTGVVAPSGAGQNPGSLLGPSSGDSCSRTAPAQPRHGKPFHVIDVGTGGGFPGLAVAIALPEARLTLVDSVKRKLDAVAAMAAELGIADRLSLRCERVERTGRRPECRGRFQLALARAVAAAPVVAEYLVPLLAADGQALLYRGQWSEADGSALQGALTALRAELGRMERLDLPGGRGVRHALSLRPRQPCPAAYPRAVGIPARQPLGQPPPSPDR